MREFIIDICWFDIYNYFRPKIQTLSRPQDGTFEKPVWFGRGYVAGAGIRIPEFIHRMSAFVLKKCVGFFYSFVTADRLFRA